MERPPPTSPIPPPVLRTPADLLPDTAPDELRRIVAYWIAKAGDRTMPRFADVDPVEIPWALAQIYVVRVDGGGAAFSYRIVGETIRERHGSSMVGKRPGDLFPPATADYILERWARIAGEPAACYTETEHPTTAGWRMRARRVQLPLGPVGGPVDNILGMTVFEEPKMMPGLAGKSEVLDLRWCRLQVR